MNQHTVLVTRRVPQPVLDRMAAVASLRLWETDLPMPHYEIVGQIAGCTGLYCLLTDPIDEAVLEAAGPGLRVVSQMAVGYDNIDVAACTRREIPVGNTPGVLTETTADLTLALLLAVARRVVEAAAFARAGLWQTWRPMELTGQDVFGSTVGIIGLGRIGKAVARRLRGFECRLLYAQPERDPEDAALRVSYVSLPQLLTVSDIVTIHCPLNEATRKLIGAAELARMKPSAILVNTARGPIVDQEALLDALDRKIIVGAGATSPTWPRAPACSSRS